MRNLTLCIAIVIKSQAVKIASIAKWKTSFDAHQTNGDNWNRDEKNTPSFLYNLRRISRHKQKQMNDTQSCKKNNNITLHQIHNTQTHRIIYMIWIQICTDFDTNKCIQIVYTFFPLLFGQINANPFCTNSHF